MKQKQRFISLTAVVAKNLIGLLGSPNLSRNLNVAERKEIVVYMSLLQLEVGAANTKYVKLPAHVVLGILRILRISVEDEKDFKKLTG